MTLEYLIQQLNVIVTRDFSDEETDHKEADRLLLSYIGNPDVTKAFDSICKWYS